MNCNAIWVLLFVCTPPICHTIAIKKSKAKDFQSSSPLISLVSEQERSAVLREHATALLPSVELLEQSYKRLRNGDMSVRLNSSFVYFPEWEINTATTQHSVNIHNASHSDDADDNDISKAQFFEGTIFWIPELRPADICGLPQAVGPGFFRIPRWFYCVERRQCDIFYYSGSCGNLNNFPTKEICLAICAAPSASSIANVSTTTSSATTTSMEDTAPPYDVMVILDTSDSIEANRPGNFAAMKTFLRELVSKFTIGQKKTRVGVYKFGTSGSLEWDLMSSKTENLANLEAAIGYTNTDGIHYSGGTTCIICGFNGTKATFANTASSQRPGVPQVALLITDGVSNRPSPSSLAGNTVAQNDAALQLQQAGINLIALGVGDEPDFNALLGYTHDPSKVVLVRGTDYNVLSTVIDKVATLICESPPTSGRHEPPPLRSITMATTMATSSPALTLASKNCATMQHDVLILLDASINEKHINNYNAMKNYLKKFVSKLSVDPNKTRVGLIRFSSQASVEWNLTSSRATDLSSLQNEFDNVPYVSSDHTCIRCALLAALPLFEAQARPGVSKVVFLLTDAKNNVGADPQDAAKRLRDDGVAIYAFGLGKEADWDELFHIVGDNTVRAYIDETKDNYAAMLTDELVDYFDFVICYPNAYIPA